MTYWINITDDTQYERNLHTCREKDPAYQCWRQMGERRGTFSGSPIFPDSPSTPPGPHLPEFWKKKGKMLYKGGKINYKRPLSQHQIPQHPTPSTKKQKRMTISLKYYWCCWPIADISKVSPIDHIYYHWPFAAATVIIRGISIYIIIWSHYFASLSVLKHRV